MTRMETMSLESRANRVKGFLDYANVAFHEESFDPWKKSTALDDTELFGGSCSVPQETGLDVWDDNWCSKKMGSFSSMQPSSWSSTSNRSSGSRRRMRPAVKYDPECIRILYKGNLEEEKKLIAHECEYIDKLKSRQDNFKITYEDLSETEKLARDEARALRVADRSKLIKAFATHIQQSNSRLSPTDRALTFANMNTFADVDFSERAADLAKQSQDPPFELYGPEYRRGRGSNGYVGNKEGVKYAEHKYLCTKPGGC